MPTTVYTKQAQKNANGVIFAPGRDEKTGRYFIFQLCENYDGRVRGGSRKTWRVVPSTAKKARTVEEAKAQFRQLQEGLTLEEAKALFEKKVGVKLYAEVA